MELLTDQHSINKMHLFGSPQIFEQNVSTGPNREVKCATDCLRCNHTITTATHWAPMKRKNPAEIPTEISPERFVTLDRWLFL